MTSLRASGARRRQDPQPLEHPDHSPFRAKTPIGNSSATFGLAGPRVAPSAASRPRAYMGPLQALFAIRRIAKGTERVMKPGAGRQAGDRTRGPTGIADWG